MTRVLVSGFGPFGEVGLNPSAGLALAMHGQVVGDVVCIGTVLPVSYERAGALLLQRAAAIGAGAVLALGVATHRSEVTVERVARRRGGTLPDCDGRGWAPGPGPEEVLMPCDVAGLCVALGATPSEDAGAYVCNATAWALATGFVGPSAFVHVPSDGTELERVRLAVLALVQGAGK